MEIKVTNVKIFKIKQRGALIGYANITIDNCFAVHGIKILEKNEKRFIAMPSRKVKSESKIHLYWCHPINKETRELLEETIFEAYDNME